LLAAPDRLIGTAVMPVTGLDDAVAEVRRCREARPPRDLAQHVPERRRHAEAGGRPVLEGALALDMKIAAHVCFGGREKVNPLLVASATRTSIW